MSDRVIMKANIFINYTKCEENSIIVSGSEIFNQECETRDTTMKKLGEEFDTGSYNGFSINSVNSSIRNGSMRKLMVNKVFLQKK